jgi:hypothetical protein
VSFPGAGLAAGLLGLAGIVAMALPARADGPVLPHRAVMLQGLDKITARTTVVRAGVGEEAAFGTLRIVPRTCLTTPPTEPPESAAFLEIRVMDPDGAEKPAFSGWMFASSPSISALEHPVYDVWVIECAEPIEPELPPEPFSPSPPSSPGQNG